MKSPVALVLFAQLLSCKAGLLPQGLPIGVLSDVAHTTPHPPKVPGCDDPETEEAADAAMHYINDHLKHGYKFALNRIEKVAVQERRPHGKIISLELDVLETECHIVSPVPAKNCTVRARSKHAVEGECDVKLIKDNGVHKVVRAKCHSSPASAEEHCPDCPHLSHLNDTNVVKTAHAALAEFNAQNTTHHHYKLLEISRGHHSHLAKGDYVEFAIVNSNCSDHHGEEHEEECHVATGDHLHYGFCTASFVKSAAEGTADHHEVHCSIYDHQPGVSHHHLTHEHLEGKLLPAGRGLPHHDLIHSHNDTSGSHSHSDEVVPVEKPAALVKRSVAAVLPLCPGRYRHFDP